MHFGWGAVGVPTPTDQNKCWAETGKNPEEFCAPCGKTIDSDIGLCAYHYKEIVGVPCEERSPAVGA